MKRALRNVFGRALRASLFADFACYRPELAGRMVVPALASLAMGDRNACDYAQASHRELLIRAGALDPTCEVHYGRPIPRSRTLHGVLIDDRLSLSIIAGGAEGQGTAARATQEWDAAMDAYACSCGRPVEAKAQRRARKGACVGCEARRSTWQARRAARAASCVGGCIFATGTLWVQFATVVGAVARNLRLPSHFPKGRLLRPIKRISLRAKR